MQAAFRFKPFEHPDKPLARDRGVYLNGQTLAVEVVYYVEGTEPAAGVERIAHEVGRPYLVRPLWHQQWQLKALRQPPFSHALLVKPESAVNAVYALVVPRT